MRKRLLFSAFAQYTVSHIVHGPWRHPTARNDQINDIDLWVEVAKLAERGCMDALFFADVLGLHDNYKGRGETAIRYGIGFPNNDASVLLAALSRETEHLGLVFTSSVLQAHPFEFARRMSTLDHISRGRMGWNIVTTFQQSAFRNFGITEMPDHAARYRWGDEYVEIAYKLWEGSWTDDALTLDRNANIVVDPGKVSSIDHVGERYRAAGPHLCAPSPQRTPVLFQAGASPAGLDFAARNAEGIFLIADNPAAAAAIIPDVRARALAAGRQPEDIVFLQGLSVVVGATEAEAKAKDREIDAYLNVEAQLCMLSGILGIDLGSFSSDTPLAEMIDKVQGIQGGITAMIEAAPPGTTPTLGDLVMTLSKTTRVVGTPSQIVHILETWVEAGVDGFNIMSILLPDTLRDFVDMVVPELQRRGLMQTEYAAGTLREKLFGPAAAAVLPASHPARQFRLPA